MRAAGSACIARRFATSRTPRRDDGPLRERLQQLAGEHPRWGVPLLTWPLRREGWSDNHKHIERVYRHAGVAERKWSRRKLTRPRVPHESALTPNERWSMDFMRHTSRRAAYFGCSTSSSTARVSHSRWTSTHRFLAARLPPCSRAWWPPVDARSVSYATTGRTLLAVPFRYRPQNKRSRSCTFSPASRFRTRLLSASTVPCATGF